MVLSTLQRLSILWGFPFTAASLPCGFPGLQPGRIGTGLSWELVIAIPTILRKYR